jgi:L-glyceraldehyde 3-phosphate reductase
VGSIAFSPLAGGQLTDRYLHGIPADSRAASGSRFLQPEQLTEASWKSSSAECAGRTRGQKLSQMALAWVLRDEKVTSVLIGASKTAQLDDAVGMLENRHFSAEEWAAIDAILRCKFIVTLAKSALTCDLGVLRCDGALPPRNIRLTGRQRPRS